MTGSPDDLGIQSKSVPNSDSLSKKERMDLSSRRPSRRSEKHRLRRFLAQIVVWNYMWMYVILLLTGLGSDDNAVLPFTLDPWVLVTLIGGIMGSSTAYFWRRMVDFAFDE